MFWRSFCNTITIAVIQELYIYIRIYILNLGIVFIFKALSVQCSKLKSYMYWNECVIGRSWTVGNHENVLLPAEHNLQLTVASSPTYSTEDSTNLPQKALNRRFLFFKMLDHITHTIIKCLLFYFSLYFQK